MAVQEALQRPALGRLCESARHIILQGIINADTTHNTYTVRFGGWLFFTSVAGMVSLFGMNEEAAWHLRRAPIHIPPFYALFPT